MEQYGGAKINLIKDEKKMNSINDAITITFPDGKTKEFEKRHNRL